MDLSMLNPEQRKAAETLEGPVLILAGAGSGKTRALTCRVANLIDHGVNPYSILALTFTNKAAKEMKERIVALVGDQAEEAWISTFHSTCARILRRDIEKLGYNRSFAIYDDDDQKSVLKEIYKTLNIDDKFIPPQEVKAKLSDAKNKLMDTDEWFRQSPRDRRSQLIHDIMFAYQERLKTLNALDFDDLLVKTLELLANHPPVLESYRRRFLYVMVDEYQDTNTAQYELIRLLTATSRNLCVVGDDDQSIYGWRGADIRNILDFEKDYPDAVVIKLEQNYRSTSNILDAANQVIAHNQGRKEKKLWTVKGTGEKIHLYCGGDERDEAAWVANHIKKLPAGFRTGDVAVLYRTNAQSRVLEEMFMKAGIAYKVFGGQKFYDRKEIRDILAYLRVCVNASDDISLRRIINVPKRSIGDSTVIELSDYAMKNEMPLYTALFDIPDTLGTRARKNVSDFGMLMMELTELKEELPLEEFVQTLIDKTGLEEQYAKEDTDEARTRIENMREFMGAIHEFAVASETPTLEAYLENVALVTDLDRSEEERDFVTMMTLHSAKGLEFPVVFLVGLEDGIFPGNRSIEDDNRLEEERRLMYVGITRAQKILYLSRAGTRMLYNQFSCNPPSRFLDEIPPRLLEEEHSMERRPNFSRGPGMGGGNYGRPQGGNWSGGNGYRGDNHPAPVPSTGRTVVFGRISNGGNGGLTLNGKPLNGTGKGSLDGIPGVRRGFGGESAAPGGSAVEVLFAPGDRVNHKAFGKGTVRVMTGSGAGARITVDFDNGGSKVLSLLIAPVTKLED